MIVNELASAIYNDIVAGLAGVVANPSISMELLEQDVVDERLAIIKKYTLLNLIPKRDLLLAINCIPVDCMSMDKCCIVNYGYTESELSFFSNERLRDELSSLEDPISVNDVNTMDRDWAIKTLIEEYEKLSINSTPKHLRNYSEAIPHFEIPQLLSDFGDDAIDFIGSTNREVSFKVYTTNAFKDHKNRIRGANKPYVYIDTTPNKNNMYDAFIFNAPLLERVSVVGIFKDLRQVEDYSCCLSELRNMSFIDAELKESLTKKKLYYYRNNYVPPTTNDQVAK